MPKKKIEPENKALTDAKEHFRNECKELVKFHCHCINQFVAGVDSPFGYLQIADVQEKLREIEDILGIEGE